MKIFCPPGSGSSQVNMAGMKIIIKVTRKLDKAHIATTRLIMF
jgi:hypothetical protein